MHPAPLSASIIAIAALASLAGCGSTEPADAGTSSLVRVTDGDTLVVRRDGKKDRVRLVGIDTPEVRTSYTDEECFGPQASARMRQLVAPGDAVRLETDPTQNERDRTGRLLAYVYRAGETRSLNERMVAEGFARTYVFRGHPFVRTALFTDLERHARQAHRGMWGACAGQNPPPPAPAPARAGSRDCPPDRPVKGNLPSRIYHRPGDASYAKTRPERCFATPGDAERAGFRPPRG